MKTMYVCEKCGTQYEEYDDCERCEASHLSIDLNGSELARHLKKRQTWRKDEVIPRTIAAATEAGWNPETGDYDRYMFGLYEFKRMLTDKEIEEIMAEKKAEEEESERWLREWKEREALKAEAKAEEA